MRYRAVLFDLVGTLIAIESAHDGVVAALGAGYADLAPALSALGAINGSPPPPGLPVELHQVWAERDLSRPAHRAAYTGTARLAGLTPEQADRLYDRGISAAAWTPYPDAVEALTLLRDRSVATALVSNIGWEVRPLLARFGLLDLLDVLVLSDERRVQKPDPAIFRLACAELEVAPQDTLMIGDNPDTDGAAVTVGCGFTLVASVPPAQRPTALLDAVVG